MEKIFQSHKISLLKLFQMPADQTEYSKLEQRLVINFLVA